MGEGRVYHPNTLVILRKGFNNKSVKDKIFLLHISIIVGKVGLFSFAEILKDEESVPLLVYLQMKCPKYRGC